MIVPFTSSRLTTSRVFLGFFLLILATKWPVLDQPPVWDGAMSVFPAAITLAHTGFDLPDLLQQPGYFDGGPNVHALSVVTWGTALAYWMIGDRPEIILPLLHIAHFFLATWALTSFWRLALHLLPQSPRRKLTALAVAVTFAICPLFFVQAGFLYLEIPILAFTATAVLAWVEDRQTHAVAWTICSALVKPSGLIVSGALALCALLTHAGWKIRVYRVAGLLIGPMVVALTMFGLRPSATHNLASIRATVKSIASIPDLLAIMLLFAVLTLVLRPWRHAVGLGPSPAAPSAAADHAEVAMTARAALVCAAMMVSFLSFYAALVPLNASVPILPRYYLQLVPFALLGTAAMLAHRNRRTSMALLVVLLLFFLANRKGHFYPDYASTNLAITERSMAYVDLLSLQNQTLGLMLDAAGDLPVFYGLSEHYKLTYPEMGYGFAKPLQGHCIYNQAPYRDGNLADFPDAFFIMYDFPWLGAEVALKVGRQANDDPNYVLADAPLRVGPFDGMVFHIRRQSPESPNRPEGFHVEQASGAESP